MKTNQKCFFFLLSKRHYNPPSKRKWSKQNDKYKTRRPLAENSNVHKINIKGEYWKQKHVNKQFVVEDANQDMINEKTSLNFFGYPNISLHSKLGGSLYIEQMDEITLCVIMNKCIKENIVDSFIWKNILNRCTRIAHKVNGNVLSYIFKYASQALFYNHYFFLTMLGNISTNLYSLNIKNCANILYAMNNNINYYNEEVYKKVVEHSSLLILNRNDIDVNSVLSLISSFYTFNSSATNGCKSYSGNCLNIRKNVNSAYLLFDSISKTFNRYDLDLSEIDSVCSALLVYCQLDRVNLFFQERNRNVVDKLVNYLNDNIEKLNIKHISILCFADCIFTKGKFLKWNYIFAKIEKEYYMLDNNYLSILLYALKDKLVQRKRIYKIIYNHILNDLSNTSLENISLVTYPFLKYGVLEEGYNRWGRNGSKNHSQKESAKKVYDKGDEVDTCEEKGTQNLEVKLSHSFHLFNDFLYGKVKYNINNFTLFQVYLFFKGLYESKFTNDKVEQLKKEIIKRICRDVHTMPAYLLTYCMKIVTDNSVRDSELISLLKDVSLVYLHMYKKIYLRDVDYTINEGSTLIEDYYSSVGKDEDPSKSDIIFLYNEKKKEVNYLSEKYVIDLNLFNPEFKYLREKFGIEREQIEKTLTHSQNFFFNYYLREKQLANFFYFSIMVEENEALSYFKEVKQVVQDRMARGELKFSPPSILRILRSMDHLHMIQKDNVFFCALLRQLCDEIYSLDLSTFLQFLSIFHKNRISHYYFLRKARYIVNMNRYEFSSSSLLNVKNMIFELSKIL
ncbi:conserved Plasmodium protein, unknown function [Plasmodium knowlesi strain H]|uniref:Uncharacterized protein n=3 Tax=Plasmodium knowlesi TaxID=5850 RepID=A0A5K1UBR0_PLAKH|nr:conserved protein, unknown function [Plasmodium knowlesi strain H]OTN67775.1 Uncharacterized protein PKNOH_S05392400 [Plasmodium knowlesi]CAA9990511.1 conserved protein, unknown function [Plasmodium knowlesi strain H]SBO19746.1 conserved Plasmodium protein, unknown function [Plasmodium knowlesi strain H]SBO22452.1 conserved Plasmodium protein, unknown function [Plasmodium knowlesi strain H]VVS79985.1 conserved protein, unknown function [Plasmodium knowlesi strain H]|eukprot:XP_002260901.1 hypothetical protein, conserved in Plasmodium species [Plasmodium knowlesi strain H]